MYNLEDHFSRKALEKQISDDINSYSIWKFKDDPRNHLGASIIGHDCKAYGWNTFRWLKFEAFDGRMYRLFNRGHEEEARFVNWLTGIGFQVKEIDDDTKAQFKISGCKGHFGGSLDSMMKAPARYGISDDLIFLGEFKTHNEKSFNKLKAKKVQIAKPMHYRQMASYGRAFGFRWALYCAVNKNDDELYFEIVKIDDGQADDLFRKADNIIFSQTQPQKIARSATYSDCKYCDFAGICHRGEAPTKNCRSCSKASPVENGEWYCSYHLSNIPREVIPLGCDHWDRII
jgi:hypothetical protein